MNRAEAERQIIERMLAARRLGSQYHAEADGLLCSLFHGAPPSDLFRDEALMRACLRGFDEGRTILHVAGDENREGAA